MKRRLSSFILLLVKVLPWILNLPPILGVQGDPYTRCGVLFNCGEFTGIGYPFWGGNRPKECGEPGLQLDCENATTTIQMNYVKYRVLDINQETQVLKITRVDLSQNLCPQEFTDTTLDSGVFEYAAHYPNLTLLYGCPALDLPLPFQFDCPVKGTTETNAYVGLGTKLSGACHASVVVPISHPFFFSFKELKELVEQGFELKFKAEHGECRECESSGGRCGYDAAGEQFVCFCPDQLAAESKSCAAGVEAAARNYSARASAGAPSTSGQKGINSWEMGGGRL